MEWPEAAWWLKGLAKMIAGRISNSDWHCRTVILATLALALWLSAACRQSVPATPTPMPTATPEPDPTEILRRAGEAMQALRTVRWSMTRTGGPAFLDDAGTLDLSEARGVFVAPDAIQATIKTLGPGIVLEMETIAIGDEQWVTNPLTLAWEKLPAGWGFNPAILFDPLLGWEALLRDDVEEATLVGLVEFAGTTRYQIEARVVGSRVIALTGGLAKDPALTANLWVDPDTYRVAQVRFVSTSVTGEPSQWVLTFQDFDGDFTVTRPES